MIWLGWRQLRAQFVAAVVLVAVYVVLLVVEAPHIGANATDVLDLVDRTQRNLYQAGIVLLAVVAPLIGAFWGAPTVARELELGTQRLVWSQSVTRRRWLTTKLLIGSVAAASIVGTLSLATTRWAVDIDGATASHSGSLPNRLTPIAFAMRGVVPVGYAVFAFVLGVLVGMLARRVLPAMAITIAIVAATQVAFPILVRPKLIAHTTAIVAVSDATFDGMNLSSAGVHLSVHLDNRGAWIIEDQTINAHGNASDLPTSFTDCIPAPDGAGRAPGGGSPAPGGAKVGRAALSACFAELTRLGYRQRVEYVSASSFWALQWRELAIYLLAAAVLAFACLRRVNRL